MTAGRPRPRAVVRLARALVLAGAGGFATAQDTTTQVFERGGKTVCVIETQVTLGGRTGGQGCLLATARNQDSEPHVVQVGYESRYGLQVSASRRLRLGPGEHVRLCLPMPTIEGASVEVYAQLGAERRGNQTMMSRGKGSLTIVALLVTSHPEVTARTAVLLEEALKESRCPHKASEVVARTPDSLPPDWTMLSSFDVVFVAGDAELPAETQEVLRQYAAAGGRVAVAEPEQLPAGPLRQAVEPIDGSAKLLLGSRARLPDLSLTETGMAALVPMLDTLDDLAGPVPVGLQQEQAIPGLGEVPTRLFLLLILVFAVVTGPVNFVVLRRKRRPMLVLLTVPALGFGTTGLILGYGMFRDGFGIQGVERTFTMLDQRTHAATALAARTLFAGLSPGRLAMPPGTLLTAPAVFRFGPETAAQLAFAEDGAVDGGVLPSRTPTVLASTWHGTARARLRFRQVGEELEPLLDGELAPAPQTSILVRDHDGGYWAGTGPRLSRIAPGVAAVAFADARAIWALPEARGQERVVVVRPPRRRPTPPPDPESQRTVIAQRAFGDELPPGSYVLRAAAAPWVPDHGLEVAYHYREHVVFGHLAAEDFVR
jgi:hypothetical protein